MEWRAFLVYSATTVSTYRDSTRHSLQGNEAEVERLSDKMPMADLGTPLEIRGILGSHREVTSPIPERSARPL